MYGTAFVPSKMICAGVATPNACFGDSGGPLTILGSDGTPVLIGNVSFGDEHCAGASDRGVYGRLSAFRAWADAVMQGRPVTPATFWRPSAGSLATALKKGIREKIRCTRSCTARLRLEVSAATASRYRLGSTTVGSARASLKAGKKKTLTAKFTSSVRSRLRKARTVPLTVVSSASSSGYVVREKYWALVLRR